MYVNKKNGKNYVLRYETVTSALKMSDAEKADITGAGFDVVRSDFPSDICPLFTGNRRWKNNLPKIIKQPALLVSCFMLITISTNLFTSPCLHTPQACINPIQRNQLIMETLLRQLATLKDKYPVCIADSG